MADSAVSFVLGKLGDFVAQEAGVLKEVGKDVVLFKDKLQWLQTFVQQADHRRRREGNAYMDVWVQQTREVALEVEDILDKFMLRANVEQGQPMWKKWFKFLSACATQISVRRELAGEINMVRARLDQISEHRTAYIKENDDSTSATRAESSSAIRVASPSISTTDGWDDELEVIGFETQRSSLEGLLFEGDERRSIVSVIGESGIGKRSLVKVVLSSPAVKGHFKACATFRLPPCASLAYTLGAIYQRLCPLADTPATVEGIQGALSDYLKDKSYLIVVNGADKFFNWSSMLDTLPDNDLGSRVVIINSLRDSEAALAGLSVRELRVSHLDEKSSILLFRRHALGRANQHLNRLFDSKLKSSGSEYKEVEMDEACKDSPESEYEKKMDQTCKDMFEITGGLPLAILLLGRLLRRKEFPEQWEDVLKLLNSVKPSSRLQGILALSFDDLPHHLKSCFLYFAQQSLNMDYLAMDLVQKWAAEGFLKPRKGESMEDVGHNYLKELISRGMVRVIEKAPVASQESVVKLVDVHQRLHAMARFETQEGSFLDISESTEIPSSIAARHLYIQNLTAAAYTHMKDASFHKLRSVSCCFPEYWKSVRQQNFEAGDQPYHNSFLRHLGRCGLLRVMDLFGLQVKTLPHVIGRLIHLRYLSIYASCLEELPSTIANLINLQTLDIRGTKVEKVTAAFWKIPTLRHVIAKELRLPKSVGVLKNMQTLEGMVCVHPWHNNISPLHSMVNLRLLKISGLTSHHWGALADAFKQLESLLEVHLTGDDIPFNLFTKFSLRRLQVLELCGRIGMSTEETEERWTLPNLTMLDLTDSRVNQGFINMIGKLPRLAKLVLWFEAYKGEELVFSQESGFRNLTFLGLYSLFEGAEWKIGSESLPKVETIHVFNCTNMRLKLEGEQVLKNLKEFLVENMPDNWGEEEAGALSEKFSRITTS
ncbi:hypothetical protein ACP70R_043803 [Stipagrostis hirtigluma subsp. patula]